MKKLEKLHIFTIGGGVYVLMELCYRRRSHITMFGAGGLCFLLIGCLRDRIASRPLRILADAAAITGVELAVGLLWNRGYGVWDYRDQPGNFLGQICPVFSAAWAAVSLGADALYPVVVRLLRQRQLTPQPACPAD